MRSDDGRFARSPCEDTESAVYDGRERIGTILTLHSGTVFHSLDVAGKKLGEFGSLQKAMAAFARQELGRR